MKITDKMRLDYIWTKLARTIRRSPYRVIMSSFDSRVGFRRSLDCDIRSMIRAERRRNKA